MNLNEFLTNALIDSLNNGLIAPELITVYAGNYLAKSLITADEMTQVQNAVASYKVEQTSNASGSTSVNASASESASNSESVSDVASASNVSSDVASASAVSSETVSDSAVASESASTPI